MENATYKNEIAKRKFYKDQHNSKGYSPKSIECFKKAIWLWQEFTNNDDFRYFNYTKAEEFKKWLKGKNKQGTKDSVSLSYCYDILRYLKLFFVWLAQQTGYKRINKTAIDYLNLTKGEVRIATQPKDQPFPTLEEVKKVIESITGKSEIEMRDKSLISLVFLTGARISAVASLPIRSFDREKLIIDQNPAFKVKTKNSKRIVSVFVSLPYKEPSVYFLEWFDYLVNVRKFSPDDPIFPATKTENGTDNLGFYNTEKVGAIFWKSSAPARKIFEKRFVQADVKYYHPHTLRHLLVKEIAKLPLTEEQKKAISQNFGHENVGTTFGSYGYNHIAEDRQIEIIQNVNFEGRQDKAEYALINKEELREMFKQAKNN